MTNNLFELVKNQNINMKDFLSQYYQFTFDKNNKTLCPFHKDTKPTLSYSAKLNTCKCFSCGATGDLINFVSLYKKISKLDACKQILDKLNITYLNPKEKETRAETKEEIQARQEAFEKQQLEHEKQKAYEQKLINLAKQKAITSMTKKATIFSKQLNLFSDHIKELNNLVFNQATTFLDWMDLYVGFDKKHDSICILNRILDKNHTTYNIKHRVKYEWDGQKHLENRVNGKWISNVDATTYPFPYEYYKQKSKTDNKVFIVEGEKDALNLLSYDLNVLTLGGVSTSWNNYKQILKNKIIYIWFDHDNAGYKACIQRYKELKEITREVFIILFYQIDSSLPNKYDISDFIFDNKFKTKDEILDKIKFCSSSLTTSLIEDMEDYTNLDLKEYYFNQPIKKFSNIKQNWLFKDKNNTPLHITSVKGEKDIKGLSNFLDNFKMAKKNNSFKTIKEEILNKLITKIDNLKKDNEDEVTQLINIFDSMVTNYDTLHKNYSQTHISDMVTSFEAMAKKTDNTFAKYNGTLAIWTGSYYHILDEKIDDIKRFILKGWMPLARVDKKKQTTANVDKIVEDIYTGAISLNEIKENQKARVINFTNGTLFITTKGKVTFKNIHSKKDAATNILNFEYLPQATAPKWNKFLQRVLPNLQDQDTLMQFIGYCFLPSHDYEAFLYLYGKSGANGKSVIMNVIKSFFGKENSSSLDLQDFEGHKLQALENKIINIGSEVDAKGLNKGQISRLKALTATKDDISIDPKNKDPRTLESQYQPKLIFAGNNKPSPSGMDDGVFRRMLLLTFDTEIDDDEKVRNLSDRFDDEKSGILLLALKNLQTLIKNGSFTKSDKLKENIEEYKDQTNPIRKYVKDCLEVDKEVIIPKDFLYSHYKEYITEKGNKPFSQSKFFSKLKEEIKSLKDLGQQRIKIPNIEKDRPRFIQGVYCNFNDVFSFTYEKEDIQTKCINYDLVSKRIIVKEELE